MLTALLAFAAGLLLGGLAGYVYAVHRWFRREVGPVSVNLGETDMPHVFQLGDRLEIIGPGNLPLSTYTITRSEPGQGGGRRIYARPDKARP
jgi:hypothetical protein